MSSELKTTFQTVLEVSPQHQKLKRLIDEIEQQKLLLEEWKQAQADIHSYSQKALMPAYRSLYVTLFQQMQVLWNSLSVYGLSKLDKAQVETKIQTLVKLLKNSKFLDQTQSKEVDSLFTYYEQAEEYAKNKKSKKKIQELDGDLTQSLNPHDDVEKWNTDEYVQAREQAKLKRQQEKQAKASRLVNQSLKTVYLKIAAIIHPDRELDESKKVEKTELLQRANEAYEQEDLFFLLKFQLEVEQNKNGSNKGLSAEQVKFYQQSLEAQSQALKMQIQELIDSLVWSNKAKILVKKSKGQLNIMDLYKQIDVDVSAVKQQFKAEKQRLSFMGKESGLEMLLEKGVL
ncbi:molecular chaperone DnaJ [Acinetobacter portensis]|uniref:Molecular chaperone DnaJ n=2 Tax=Acinetobacter TaxID=469 RepID=A0ABU5GH48_9GAMM|nr:MULTISPECIES: molecular chaperone DnaJ [Acinetobacter]MCK7610066.1 molecular chaperone DnaJ [Acinetobacter portensis]MCK7640839.1 molecular chaperone DnaJ [Acinetobacter portensis]MDY6460822.1 molecular chaperone DnaJ [Acinetobacter faecalis]MDY6549837.1 molecular chaperone DnaJ [Acinetobacter faecalis]UPO23839.1 molecular chaperone DnaJ [Acinetobacter portensis]